MKTVWTLIVSFGLAAMLVAQETPVIEENRARFRAIDIYLDAGSTPLAAYQLEFSVTNGTGRIVGIEGGDHPAFRTPPHYDPKAIQRERVILASFNTGAPAALPRGRVRVATLHLMLTGSAEPACVLKVQAAADGKARKIDVKAEWKERKNE